MPCVSGPWHTRLAMVLDAVRELRGHGEPWQCGVVIGAVSRRRRTMLCKNNRPDRRSIGPSIAAMRFRHSARARSISWTAAFHHQEL